MDEIHRMDPEDALDTFHVLGVLRELQKEKLEEAAWYRSVGFG